MIFMSKHGRTVVPEGDTSAYGKTATMPNWQACGFLDYASYGAPQFGPFDYLFPDAGDASGDPGMTAALDALADAMVEHAPLAENDSQIPPVFTYLGQFIDHDVTANTDRETAISTIDQSDVRPLRRPDVVAGLGNIRAGALNLDSLYGGGPVQGPFAEKMRKLLRFPWDRAKLWAGTLFDAGFDFLPLQRGAIDGAGDPAWDLLRLQRLVDGMDPLLTEAELKALPQHLREMFVNSDGSLRVQRAIIGDARNDENLVVAQLHLAFVRFHNKVVDQAHLHGVDVDDRQAVFDWARRMVTWHYQWLVLNAYLPTICDPDIVSDVLAGGAPLYRAFFDRVGAPAPGLMPLPLEFSVAAFRFGHSMVRHEYDWSARFGRSEPSQQHLLDRAGFDLLFAFTGGASNPMPVGGAPNAPRLPGHWSVDWERLAAPVGEDFPDRSARRIDTLLAFPLSDMINEPDGVFRHLARRNLRRGHRLNIPSAQGCLAGIAAQTGETLAQLSPAQLATGTTATAIQDAGLIEQTPLWFYVLKEAECLGTGGRLGPLGSRLVAETLAGLVLCDPASYWNNPEHDAGGRRWAPQDGVKPGGVVVDSVPALLRAAGVM